MMGTTSYLLTDVASAPFLWVAPLALYLLTFVIAFSTKPKVNAERARLWQAPLVCLLALVLPFRFGGWPMQLCLHLAAFFLTALVCHHALAARRPEPARLTDFYLTMSLGGVIGGGFNAFLAPAIFPQVWEYPLALALAGLARPWGMDRKPVRSETVILLAGLAIAVAAPLMVGVSAVAALALLLCVAACAFLLRGRGPAFALLIGAALVAGTVAAGGGGNTIETRRSFFGVSRVAEADLPGQGRVRLLYHGTTLHGAEGLSAANRCTPMTYYAPQTPIGQVFGRVTAAPGPLRIGAVGLGAGAVAAYIRPGQTLRFFEIDPAVETIARSRFDYVGACAGGRIDYRMGDARLTLARERTAGFDLLLIDAFSSDSVPTHLLTVEAMKLYLDRVKPGGLVLLHLTNRNLALVEPAAAVARAAGAVSLVQRFDSPPERAPTVTRSTVMAVSRDSKALAALAADPRWRAAAPNGVRPWTDDYVNVAGALVRHLRDGR
jgi:spermidine synthase